MLLSQLRLEIRSIIVDNHGSNVLRQHSFEMDDLAQMCFGQFDGYYSIYPSSILYGGYINGQLVAMTHITIDLSDVPPEFRYLGKSFVYNTCTHPQYRGRGYAEALYKFWIQYKSGGHFANIHPSNTASIQLHSKLGFVQISEDLWLLS